MNANDEARRLNCRGTPREMRRARVCGITAGLATIPILHGLDDDRVKVVTNGMTVSPSCPNHMNPPLSYIDPSNVAQVSVMAGITPVSMGGDSIGGTIAVDSPQPVFAASGRTRPHRRGAFHLLSQQR